MSLSASSAASRQVPANDPADDGGGRPGPQRRPPPGTRPAGSAKEEPAIARGLLHQLGTAADSYARSAQVAAARRGQTVRRGILDAPSAVRGIAVEATWLAAHVAFYPVGLVSRRFAEPRDVYTLAGLSPLRRSLLVGDVEAAGTPILLLHGLVDNRSIFTRLHRSLRRRGFGRVASLNLQLYATDVETAAKRLGNEVEALCERTGYQQIHVVAHSLGGLVARYYVQKLGGDARVHTLVTLGTPHQGTRLARMLPAAVPYRLVAQLRPNSPLLRELAEPSTGCGTRFVAISGELDTVVRPVEAAFLIHPDLRVRNVMMPGLGHHALPFDSRVVHEVANVLARLDGYLGNLDTGPGAAAGPGAASAGAPTGGTAHVPVGDLGDAASGTAAAFGAASPTRTG